MKRLFVRRDSKVDGPKMSELDFQEHIDYLTGISEERFFMGGGYREHPGGMIIFEAKDLDEAARLSDKDPIIKKNYYTYELLEWDIAIKSKHFKM